jgi:hypothetical protein
MATDPQSLFTQASCYACYTEMQWKLLELMLYAQWSSENTNLIPAGSLYNGSQFAFPTNIGQSYRVTLNANESSMVNGGQFITVHGPTQFFALGTQSVFTTSGGLNMPVTAILATP